MQIVHKKRFCVNGFERRTQRKKDQTIRASLQLFCRNGFKKVSVSEIAKLAGTSQVTIYNHFGSKNELIRTALLSLFEGKIAEYAAILKSGRPYFERLEAVVLDKSTLVKEFQGEILEEAYREHPLLVESINEMRRRAYEEITVPFLDEGRAIGAISSAVSNEAVILFIEIFRRGFPASTDSGLSVLNNPDLLNELNSLVLYGIYGSGKHDAVSDAE